MGLELPGLGGAKGGLGVTAVVAIVDVVSTAVVVEERELVDEEVFVENDSSGMT